MKEQDKKKSLREILDAAAASCRGRDWMSAEHQAATEYIWNKGFELSKDDWKEIRDHVYDSYDMLWEIMHNMDDEARLALAKKWWDELGGIPVDESDSIDEDFKIWGKGTGKIELWHDFEELFNVSVAMGLMEMEA